MSFWNSADFAFQHQMEDSINDEIWPGSVNFHKEKGFTPADLKAFACFPQQAILPGGLLLPLVPDVLGSEWDHAEAVHIVGMAYAGFIEGISTRHFPLEEYVKTSNGSWRDFARIYLSKVIQDDSAYYEPLCPIMEYFPSKSRFSLFDLCRASLVKREVGCRVDRPLRLSKKDELGQQCFASYCEHYESQRWTWQRLTQSSARCVIALGFVAEHGLLNLFVKHGQCVWDASSKNSWNPHKNSDSPLWTVNYANTGLKLRDRIQSPTWWCVGPSFEEVRWNVIPIYHPSVVSRYDRGYEKTLKILLPAAAPVL